MAIMQVLSILRWTHMHSQSPTKQSWAFSFSLNWLHRTYHTVGAGDSPSKILAGERGRGHLLLSLLIPTGPAQVQSQMHYFNVMTDRSWACLTYWKFWSQSYLVRHKQVFCLYLDPLICQELLFLKRHIVFCGSGIALVQNPRGLLCDSPTQGLT